MDKKYIEYDSLIGKLIAREHFSTSSEINYDELIQLLYSQPIADVQKVIRCKDCQKFYPNLSFWADNNTGIFGYCQITNMDVSPDFYCGYGKKKERENNG